MRRKTARWIWLFIVVRLILLLLYIEFQMHVSPYYSTVHGLWPMEFPNGGQVEVTNTAMCHVWSDLLWSSVGTVFTLNFPATKHPPRHFTTISTPISPSSTDKETMHYTLVQMYCHEINITNTRIKKIIF